MLFFNYFFYFSRYIFSVFIFNQSLSIFTLFFTVRWITILDLPCLQNSYLLFKFLKATCYFFIPHVAIKNIGKGSDQGIILTWYWQFCHMHFLSSFIENSLGELNFRSRINRVVISFKVLTECLKEYL